MPATNSSTERWLALILDAINLVPPPMSFPKINSSTDQWLAMIYSVISGVPILPVSAILKDGTIAWDNTVTQNMGTDTVFNQASSGGLGMASRFSGGNILLTQAPAPFNGLIKLGAGDGSGGTIQQKNTVSGDHTHVIGGVKNIPWAPDLNNYLEVIIDGTTIKIPLAL